VHTDGTIFTLSGMAIIGIDPTTGTQKFSVPVKGSVGVWGAMFLIAGDGYYYTTLLYCDPCSAEPDYHFTLLRVDSRGNYDSLELSNMNCEAHGMISNADKGVLVSFACGPPDGSTLPGMAVTTGTSVSLVSPPEVPGQGSPFVVEPLLQAQDGSFVGECHFSNANDPATGYEWGAMVSFDAAGNVRWMVPNDWPRIATADGGVIGRSGTVYDANGNATGTVGSLPTYSWKGAYRVGSTNSVVPGFDMALMATTYAAVPGGNLTGNGFSLVHHTFGLVFCGTEGDGACPANQYNKFDNTPVTFSYLPAASLNDKTYNAAPPKGPADFSSSYPSWVTTLRRQANNAYRAAFANLPAIVDQGWKNNPITASQFEHTVYVSGKWNLGGDFGIQNEVTGDTNGYKCISNHTCPVSNVYYLAMMGYAQIAADYLNNLKDWVSPAYQFPAPTDPSALAQFNRQFNQVITATGIGIGNIAAHETGHQLAVPYIDCSSPRNPTSCPVDYMYQNGNGGASNYWFYGSIPGATLTWSPAGNCAIYKFLLGSVPKGYPCE
jgi:hypothetical protein